MNPIERGIALEKIIYDSVSKIPGITRNLREKDIHLECSDPSLNGVDHWITIDNIHFFIQDKWKDYTPQSEISHFLYCAKRLQSKLPYKTKSYLILASKKEPTKNSKKILEESGAIIINTMISIEALAMIVVHTIQEYVKHNALQLKSIVEDTEEYVVYDKNLRNHFWSGIDFLMSQNLIYT